MGVEKPAFPFNATCRRMGKAFGIEFAKTRMHAPGTIWKALALHEAGHSSGRSRGSSGTRRRAARTTQ